MELPLGNLGWSTIDLFIIHSLLASAKHTRTCTHTPQLEAADER